MRVASFSLLFTLIIGPIAGAQTSLPENTRNRPVSGPESPLPQTPGSASSGTLSVAMPIFGGSPVKGLPFSATEMIVSEQTLGDGTTIKTRNEVLLWRDATGRMRIESALKSKDPQMQGRVVTVMDPAEKTIMCWISENQYAHLVTITHLPDFKPNGAHSSANINREALPMGNIAGLHVEGIRITKVIPARAAGNDREITVTSETWTSSDLKIMVRQVTDDPRTGKVTMELTNIDRSNPAPSLFKVPEGYTVRDMQLPISPAEQP